MCFDRNAASVFLFRAKIKIKYFYILASVSIFFSEHAYMCITASVAHTHWYILRGHTITPLSTYFLYGSSKARNRTFLCISLRILSCCSSDWSKLDRANGKLRCFAKSVSMFF